MDLLIYFNDLTKNELSNHNWEIHFALYYINFYKATFFDKDMGKINILKMQTRAFLID